MIILNGKDTPLNQNSGTLPDVSGAMLDYFQPLVFKTIVKTVVDFQVVETPTNVNTAGVWQPLTGRKLEQKPEGQRLWNWFTLHALPTLILKVDDALIRDGIRYRVTAQKDYSLYGYVEYEVVQDYTGGTL